MAERAIFAYVAEYVVNCAWQIPLLAAGAWLLVKAMRPGVLAQHRLWLSVLAMMKEKNEQMAKLQKQMESGELKQKLDEATRLLEEVRKQMETMQAK